MGGFRQKTSHVTHFFILFSVLCSKQKLFFISEMFSNFLTASTHLINFNFMNFLTIFYHLPFVFSQNCVKILKKIKSIWQNSTYLCCWSFNLNIFQWPIDQILVPIQVHGRGELAIGMRICKNNQKKLKIC